MRWIIVGLILFVVGCAKKASSDAGNASPGATFSVPSNCNYQSTGTHTFVDWSSDPQNAQDYLCSFESKMTCHLFLSSDHRELVCEGTDFNDPNGPPSSAQSIGGGVHTFLGGIGLLTTSAYEIDPIIADWDCHYYEHFADGSYHFTEELFCLDINE